MPDRIQLSRRPGWRLPAGAVLVARPSKWGNPYAFGRDASGWFVKHAAADGGLLILPAKSKDAARATSLSLFRPWAEAGADEIQAELRGKALACWCPKGVGCHADILLQIANRPMECEAV